MISTIEHPIARLAKSPCIVCGGDTLHRGLQCLVCGTDFVNAKPSVPFKYSIRNPKQRAAERQSTPVRELGVPNREATAELWMSTRLGCREVVMGDTTTESRKGGIRARILELGVADKAAGRRAGRDESWRALFRRIYREDL